MKKDKDAANSVLVFYELERIGNMFNGPLSERIDCITEKPQGESVKKPDKVKPKPALSLLTDPSSEESIEMWETTQMNCPIPSRCPDQWVH